MVERSRGCREGDLEASLTGMLAEVLISRAISSRPLGAGIDGVHLSCLVGVASTRGRLVEVASPLRRCSRAGSRGGVVARGLLPPLSRGAIVLVEVCDGPLEEGAAAGVGML